MDPAKYARIKEVERLKAEAASAQPDEMAPDKVKA